MRDFFYRLPAPERKVQSWLYVVLCALLIFVTIPLARMIQRMLEQLLGSWAYFAAAAIAGLFIAVLVLSYILRRRKHQIPRRIGMLLVMLAGAVWIMRNQLQTPAEAIHFFEYGLLSYLVFRAWSHHVRDRLIYPICVVTLLIITSMDEFLQWLIPGRVWDYRDIRLNVMSGLFVQGIIALVINPSGIEPGIKPRSVRILCRGCWIAIAFMAAAVSNTPARVDLYSTRIPFLHFLSNIEGVMTEYGYKHNDPEIGIFNSRFSGEELQAIDRERGDEVGATLRRYKSLIDYKEFIQIFSAKADPFMHELRVHLYRRDYYFTDADRHRVKDPGRYVHNMTIAYRENQILEKYFTRSMIASGMTWDKTTLDLVSRHIDRNYAYTSPVSMHLVTLATELELWIFLGSLAVITAVAYRRYGRDAETSVK